MPASKALLGELQARDTGDTLGMTADELKASRNLSERGLRALLKAAIARNALIVGHRNTRNVCGGVSWTPTYRIKEYNDKK